MLRTIAWTVLVLLIAACSSEQPAEAPAPEPASSPAVEVPGLTVYTVNYPLAYFAERILGDAGDVVFPAPADGDPAYWSPGPDDIAGFQSADIILLNGAGYADWVGNATLPRSKLVDTTAAVTDKLIEIENAVTHTHGPTGDHSHDETAFTTWLDPGIALAQARAVLEALVGLRPGEEASFQERFDALAADLDELGQGMEAIAALLGDRPLLFSHPVYQYLEKRYNLNGFSLHWEPDADPGERQWRGLQSVLQDHPATLMIWEAEPLPEVRQRLADLGVDSVVFAPAGNRPAEGDWLHSMRAGVEALSSR